MTSNDYLKLMLKTFSVVMHTQYNRKKLSQYAE